MKSFAMSEISSKGGDSRSTLAQEILWNVSNLCAPLKGERPLNLRRKWTRLESLMSGEVLCVTQKFISQSSIAKNV